MESPKTMSKTRKEPVRAARRTGAPARAGRPRREVKRAALGRDEWVRAARDLLVRGDIGAVKVGALATQLGVTRESFYWHFASLADLHEELLRDWESDNTHRFELQHKRPADARHDLASIRFFLLGEETYRATWDTAIRNWARVSRKAARVVARIDEQRAEMVKALFLELGYDETEAKARARVYYLFQVGYYTIELQDGREQRAKLLPHYLRILLGDRYTGPT